MIRQEITNTGGVSSQTSKGFTSLSMKHNLVWMLLGNLSYGASQWGLLVVLAKLTSPEILGRFSLGLAVSAPVIMFLNFQLHTIQATDVNDQYCFADYFGLRLLTNCLAIIIIIIICFIGSYDGQTGQVIIIIGIAKVFEATSDIIMGWFQKIERMDLISKSLIIRGLVSLIALSAALYLTHNLLWATAALAIAWALVLICYDVINCRKTLKARYDSKIQKNPTQTNYALARFYPRFEIGKIQKLIKMTLPLGFVTLLISLDTNIPRYFIEKNIGQRELGIFTSMAYLILLGSKIIAAICQVAVPKLARYYFSGAHQAYLRLMFSMIALCASIGAFASIAAYFFGEQILIFFYNSEYASNSSMFVWIMTAGMLQYVATFLWVSLIATRQVNVQVPLNITYIIIQITGCAFFISQFGIMGAAYSIVVASAAQVLGNSLPNFFSYRKMVNSMK